MLRFLMLIVLLINLTKCSHRRHFNYNNHQITSSTSYVDGKLLDKVMVIDSKTGIKYNPYSKNHPGRRVCQGQRDVLNPTNHHHPHDYYNIQPFKFVYETIKDTNLYKYDVVHYCCPGWTQVIKRSHGCNKPYCTIPCQNGGVCTKPEVCSCRKGFNGSYCEKDVNECKENKPCDQICRNNYGSYSCECREDFVLQSDGQSCKREDNTETPLEATDIEMFTFNRRILKLENMFKNSHEIWAEKEQVNKIAKNVENVFVDISYLKRSIQDMVNIKNDITMLKNKVAELVNKRNHDGDEKSKTLQLLTKGCNKFCKKTNM